MNELNALGRVKHSWRNWTRFFLHAITTQAQQNIAIADATLALYEALKARFIKTTKSRYAVPLLDTIFQLQYFQANQLKWKEDVPSKPTLSTMLQALKREGALQEFRTGTGRRSSIWWLPELVQLIEKR